MYANADVLHVCVRACMIEVALLSTDTIYVCIHVYMTIL